MTYATRCYQAFGERTTLHGPAHSLQSKYKFGRILWLLLTMAMALLGFWQSGKYIYQYMKKETGSSAELINIDEQEHHIALASLAYCPQDWLNLTAFQQSNVSQQAIVYAITLIPSVDPYVFAQLRSVPGLLEDKADIVGEKTTPSKWGKQSADKAMEVELAYKSGVNLTELQNQLSDAAKKTNLINLKDFLSSFAQSLLLKPNKELLSVFTVEVTGFEIRFGRLCQLLSVRQVDEAVGRTLPPIISKKILRILPVHSISEHTLFPIKVDISPYRGDIVLTPLQDRYANRVIGLTTSTISSNQAKQGVVPSLYYYQASKKTDDRPCESYNILTERATKKVKQQTCQNKCIHKWIENKLSKGCTLVSPMYMTIDTSPCNKWALEKISLDEFVNNTFIQSCYAETCADIPHICEDWSFSFNSLIANGEQATVAASAEDDVEVLLESFGDELRLKTTQQQQQQQWVHLVQFQLTGHSMILKEFRLLNFGEMVGAVGGTMGLCMGLSIITFIHIIIFWCRALFRCADVDDADDEDSTATENTIE